MTYKAILVALLLISNFASAKPKLVVNVVVSQMRYDYLIRFHDNFTQGGFNRLIKEGVSCDRAHFNYLATTTNAGLATISTGANPSTHGVIGSYWFDYTTAQKIDLINDPKSITVGSDELDVQVSPKMLIASTLSDALKSISPQSKVICIALDGASSVIIGGHTADAAYWFSRREGNMVTSSYYQEKLPDWVVNFNKKEQAAQLFQDKWTPMKESKLYHNVFSKDIELDAGFSLMKPKFDAEKFASSPSVNILLRDFAAEAILGEGLGKGSKTDMINIVFDSMRLIGEKYGTNSIELEDAYYRLDDVMESLINFLDVHISRENYVIALTSDHGAVDPMIESSRIPSGRFDAAQFVAIINGFLGGQLKDSQKWVLDYSNNQLFLNRSLIYEKGFDLKDIQDKVALFAVQFRGVAQAITSHSLQNSNFNTGILNKAQNSYYQRHSGDIIISYLPGWAEKTEKMSDSGSSYNYDTHVPLIFFGDGIGTQNIAQEIDMTDVAPTISHIMEVAPPNASTGKPITEIYVK